jgi:hypothetical protein
MSVHKDPRSPYWHYDFQINGRRYYGSTKCKDKRDAKTVERAEREKVQRAEREKVRQHIAQLRQHIAQAKMAREVEAKELKHLKHLFDTGGDPLPDAASPRPHSPIADKWRSFTACGIEPTCFLYRHYDAAGDLLYVGMSLHVWSRQMAHLQKAAWANSIYQIVIEPFGSREELIEAEAIAIKTEYPRYNKVHNDRTLRRALVRTGASMTAAPSKTDAE